MRNIERTERLNNFYIAIYELFGVCASKVTLPAVLDASYYVMSGSDKVMPPTPVVDGRTGPHEVRPVSILAPGTVCEGTLRVAGDLDVAGEFHGDIICEGTVVLRNTVEGNVSARRLHMLGSTVTGNLNVSGAALVDQKSKVYGDVTAREVLCAGRLEGMVSAGDTVALEATAKVHGDIKAGSLSIARGAVLRGSVWVAKDMNR